MVFSRCSLFVFFFFSLFLFLVGGNPTGDRTFHFQVPKGQVSAQIRTPSIGLKCIVRSFLPCWFQRDRFSLLDICCFQGAKKEMEVCCSGTLPDAELGLPMERYGALPPAVDGCARIHFAPRKRNATMAEITAVCRFFFRGNRMIPLGFLGATWISISTIRSMELDGSS